MGLGAITPPLMAGLCFCIGLNFFYSALLVTAILIAVTPAKCDHIFQ